MVTLTQQEQQRLMVLNALERSEISMADAARLLGRSKRQVRRLRAAYRRRGAVALAHGNRGRPSPRRLADRVRRRVIRLAKTTYAGVNFQHLSELLAEHEHLTVSRPTLSRHLRAAGIPSPRRRRPRRHRQRRPRLPQAGMLVQMDGSHHAWLQDRGPTLVLLHAVDDATGTVVGAVFREHEDAQGYFTLLRQLTTTSGLPLAVYTDRHGIFKRAPLRQRPLTLEEQLQGTPEPTQVGRALRELGIQWIPASSPQAKGRVERVGGTFQDRLVSELRLAQIHDLEGANAFLSRFLPRYNARFSHPPAVPGSAFRAWPATLDPETVFCFKYRATVANDHTVTLGPHHLQVLPGAGGRRYAKARVELHERLDGTVVVSYQGQRLRTHPLASVPSSSTIRARTRTRIGPIAAPARSEGASPRQHKKPVRPRPWRPPLDHPWHRYAKEGKRRKELRTAGVSFSLNG